MVRHPPPLRQWLHYKTRAHCLPCPDFLPNGEESGYGNSERDMTGWHCGTGSQGVDKPLPPGKKQTQSQGLPALAYIPHTCPNGV